MLFHRICSILFSLVALYCAWGAIHLIYNVIVYPLDTVGEYLMGFIVLVMIFFCVIDLAKGACLAEKAYRKVKQQKERFEQYWEDYRQSM